MTGKQKRPAEKLKRASRVQIVPIRAVEMPAGPAPSIKPERKLARRRASASLTQKIYERIRADIFSCVLAPGSEISEAELAARFKVSKTPVREALAALRAEGFVHTFPRRGYQIVPITFGDMQELFDIRTIVEAGAAELATRRITAVEIDHLDKLAEVIYDASKQPNLKRVIQANREFHGAIAKASKNQRLYELVLKQIDALERFFYLGARLRDISAETKSDHQGILEALKAGDSAAVRKAIIQHNEVTRVGLFDALARSAGTTKIRLQ